MFHSISWANFPLAWFSPVWGPPHNITVFCALSRVVHFQVSESGDFVDSLCEAKRSRSWKTYWGLNLMRCVVFWSFSKRCQRMLNAFDLFWELIFSVSLYFVKEPFWLTELIDPAGIMSAACGQTHAQWLHASNLPAPLTNGELVQVASLKDVPTSEDLAQWLLDKGLDTSDWGKENTKDVSKFWKEIKLNEAGLEVWKTADGTMQPVRTTHVLRAKVTSPDRYPRDIFLFNTWQQYGDGRTRTRNGLLSEKLTTDEMPLEENLHEVCRRAVTEEEMQRVVESTMKIGPGRPAPDFDPNYQCPLEVVGEHFVDHIIELEKSKSYPGLLTMYHLYTVDIICTGLPLTDLNTLEFEHADKDGNRKLKYIHAWVWLEWPQIQRYLFEGSVLKETKGKGSFADADALTTWLSQFDLHMDKWGKGTLKSVDHLFREIENEDSQLELWGRQDGVPMLMRVTHVLQLRVTSSDPSLKGKFLFSSWAEATNGKRRVTHTLPAMKLTLKDMPYDLEKFTTCAEGLLADQFTNVVDIHYRFTAETSLSDCEPLGLRCMTYNLWNSAMMLRNLPHTGVSSLCTICTAWKLSVQACQSVTLHPWMWRAVPSTVWKVGRGHLPSVSWMSWDIDLWSWSESRDKRCNFGTMWAKRVWMQSASWMNFFKSWPQRRKAFKCLLSPVMFWVSWRPSLWMFVAWNPLGMMKAQLTNEGALWRLCPHQWWLLCKCLVSRPTGS